MSYEPGSNCPVCLDPTSMCVCSEQPERKLALQIILDAAGEPETVTIGREAFITLCARAYAWGQHQSNAARVSSIAAPTVWPQHAEVQLVFTENEVIVDTGDKHGDLPGNVGWKVKDEQAKWILAARRTNGASKRSWPTLEQAQGDLNYKELYALATETIDDLLTDVERLSAIAATPEDKP
jgi:hypothetical protein